MVEIEFRLLNMALKLTLILMRVRQLGSGGDDREKIPIRLVDALQKRVPVLVHRLKALEEYGHDKEHIPTKSILSCLRSAATRFKLNTFREHQGLGWTEISPRQGRGSS
jgi:hypothetical protein